MRQITLSTLVVGATVAACLAPSPAGAAAPGRAVKCRNYVVRIPTGTGGHKPFHFVHIVASGLGCRAADTFLAAFAVGPPPAGWKSVKVQTVKGSYPVKATFRKGKATIVFQYSCNGC